MSAANREAFLKVSTASNAQLERRQASAFATQRIDIVGVSKAINVQEILKNVDLAIEPRELIALLGPSGSGKTTLLRIIAGLEAADQGAILFGGEDAADLSVQERRVGFVFQAYALFRHMTAFDNIAYGLRVRPRRIRPCRREIERRTNELLNMVQLAGLGARYPGQLSGGQRQRVALARAMAIEPRVLLLDEPFGALDAKVRKDLRQWLRKFHDRTGLTTVFVTHDQNEAMELADRVAILNSGRIEQVDSTEETGQSHLELPSSIRTNLRQIWARRSSLGSRKSPLKGTKWISWVGRKTNPDRFMAD